MHWRIDDPLLSMGMSEKQIRDELLTSKRELIRLLLEKLFKLCHTSLGIFPFRPFGINEKFSAFCLFAFMDYKGEKVKMVCQNWLCRLFFVTKEVCNITLTFRWSHVGFSKLSGNGTVAQGTSGSTSVVAKVRGKFHH